MRLILALMMVSAFLLGWIASIVAVPAIASDGEQPFSLFSASEKESPFDHIAESNIHVYKDNIVLDIEDAIFAKYADTNSMDPVLDKGANGIEIIPQDESQISIGDIISYKSTIRNTILVHRVVKIDTDDEGTYFIVKGDNNPIADPEKVRFNKVHGILIGIIY